VANAAFKVVKCTGTNASTETDVSKAPNFLSVDAVHSTPSDYKIKRPASIPANPTYSFEMWLRLECTVAPDNECENFRFYGPAFQPDHEDNPGNCLFVMWGTTASGATPVNTASSVATVAQYEVSGGTGYFDPASALSVGVNPGDNVIDAVGEKTDYLVAQLKIVGGAQAGSMLGQIWFYLWEES
jgi:hypothetical protein